MSRSRLLGPSRKRKVQSGRLSVPEHVLAVSASFPSLLSIYPELSSTTSALVVHSLLAEMSSTPTSRPKSLFQLTPEQLALQAKRRELKAKKDAEQKAAAAANGGIVWPQGSEILLRPWLDVPPPPEPDVTPGKSVKVMTWNVCDCLKVCDTH